MCLQRVQLSEIAWAGLGASESARHEGNSKGFDSPSSLSFPLEAWETQVDGKTGRSKQNRNKKTEDFRCAEGAHLPRRSGKSLFRVTWGESVLSGTAEVRVEQDPASLDSTSWRQSEIKTRRAFPASMYPHAPPAAGPPYPWKAWEAQHLSRPWAHREDSFWKLGYPASPQASTLLPRPSHCHLLWETFSGCPRIMAPDLILEYLLHYSLPTVLYMFLPFF